MQKPDPLIRTKLRLPFIRPSRVPRPRLQARILEGLRGPLTLVVAPAGFGKTTLVAESLAAAGMPAAWVSLDAGDNQPGRFLSYLIAALQGVDAEIGGDAAQLLAGMQPPPDEAVLSSLVNDIEGAGREIVLVLDDYQFITSTSVYAAAAFMLEHCPQGLHLLVAARSDPALPLARLRARGQLVELRAADLRFTPEEAAQFLNEVMALGLDGGAIAVLEERTEGWVAGLQMAALSLRDREDVAGFIASFSGTHRHILDYLLEEILASQPPEVQQFLLLTSLPERLTAPLCDVLMGTRSGMNGQQGNWATGQLGDRDSQLPNRPVAQLPSSQSILEYLDRNNLFIQPLDEERAWFRYHNLFADLLRARLQQAEPDLIPELHRRASAWMEQNGLIAEAVQHRLAAGEMDRAVELIERHGPVRWVEGDPSIIQIASSLPVELLACHPRLSLYLAWLLISQGSIEKVLPLLNRLKLQLADDQSINVKPWMPMLARLALTFLYAHSGTPGLDPLPDPAALDEIPAGDPILRDTADVLYGMSLGRLGEIDRAVEFSAQAIQKKKGSQVSLENISLIPFLATMYLFLGRLHAAASLCREFLASIHEKRIRNSTACNLQAVLGDVLYEWNLLEEAENTLRDAIQANEPWGNIMTAGFGMLALINVLQAREDYAGAMQAVEKFENRLQSQMRPIELEGPYWTVKVRVQLASGDLQTASEWADRVEQAEDFHRSKENYLITLAYIRLAQARYVETEKIIAAVPKQPLAGNRIGWQLETQLLMAAAIAGQGRLTEALAILEACLALAEPEGYIQVFLNIGEPARELLTASLRSAAAGHKLFAQKLLEAFPRSGAVRPSVPQQAGLVEPLSERELEVLRLISQGKTNQEIAQQLVVATGTVKAHAAAIFRKLDVANRTEAGARARQLGLLT